MSIGSVLLLAAIATAVPLLSVLTLWSLTRADSGPSDPRTGMPDKFEVSGANRVALVTCFAGVGAFLAYGAFLDQSWFGSAISVFFFTKATYLHLVFRSSQTETSYPLRLAPKQWLWLAGGACASAILALIAGAAGEGLASWFLALFMAWLTALLVAASRRTSPLEL